ncbi:MAG: hypothetical protein ACYSTI_07705, partial [Planctomycetota bacterium]
FVGSCARTSATPTESANKQATETPRKSLIISFLLILKYIASHRSVSGAGNSIPSLNYLVLA